MKNYIFIVFIIVPLVFSCKEKSPIEIVKISNDELKKISSNADTSYLYTTGGSNLTTESKVYINRKTGDTVEVLKDESNHVLFIGHRRKGKCISCSEYYPNGQIQCNSNRNIEGLLHGILKCYHEDGRIRILGEYSNGKKIGEWKNYSSNGELISIDRYEDGIKK